MMINSIPQANVLNPVIITGCQRSGTTLLRTMLGQHPQLLEHPDEPQFILELYQRFGKQISDVPTAVAFLAKHPYLPDTLSITELKKAYENDHTLSLAEFFKKYIQLWGGEKLQTQRPILKDPAFIFHLDLITTLFPQATIIHIIRDPRGCVASQKARWPQYTIWETSRIWKSAINTGQEFFQSTNRPFLELLFEDLLTHPTGELERICEFLEIPFTPSLLTFEEKTTIYEPGAAPKQVHFTAVDKNKLQQWQTSLSPLDVQLIEHICRNEIQQLAYELLQPKVEKSNQFSYLINQYLRAGYRINGRRLKHIARKTGWRLGFGLLKIPQKK